MLSVKNVEQSTHIVVKAWKILIIKTCLRPIFQKILFGLADLRN
jgi:hypothetical protein